MSNLNIYLASRMEEENQILIHKLESLLAEFPALRFVSLHPQGLARTVDARTNLAILNVAELTDIELAQVKDLRATGYRGQVLVTAKPGSADVLKSVHAMRSTVFLEKPFEAKDLVGLVKKMLMPASVEQQVHRRYPTNEIADVEFYGWDHSFASRLSNMSKGGACMVCEEVDAVRIGDMLKLSLELKAVRRSYEIAARVVWKRGDDIGVEFVGTPHIKKAISNPY